MVWDQRPWLTCFPVLPKQDMRRIAFIVDALQRRSVSGSSARICEEEQKKREWTGTPLPPILVTSVLRAVTFLFDGKGNRLLLILSWKEVELSLFCFWKKGLLGSNYCCCASIAPHPLTEFNAVCWLASLSDHCWRISSNSVVLGTEQVLSGMENSTWMVRMSVICEAHSVRQGGKVISSKLSAKHGTHLWEMQLSSWAHRQHLWERPWCCIRPVHAVRVRCLSRAENVVSKISLHWRGTVLGLKVALGTCVLHAGCRERWMSGALFIMDPPPISKRPPSLGRVVLYFFLYLTWCPPLLWVSKF